jgi:hypothetical protein
MQFLTTGYRLKKEILSRAEGFTQADIDEKEAFALARDLVYKELRSAMEEAKMARDIYNEVYGNETSKQSFFITIRPDETRIGFEGFKDLVLNFIKRKMFTKYTLSFEQKGTSVETLGKGFHCHIVATMTCRSKGEVLRNTISTFKGCTADNCIKVIVASKPQEIIDNYLKEYNSDDGHKEVTMEWDKLWRESHGLQSLYESAGV